MNWQDPEARKAYFRAYYKQRRKKQLELVSPIIACTVCGSTHNLHIDHIDPSKKEFHVNKRMLNKEELAKCQILCEPCHNKKTGLERLQPIKHGSIYAFTQLRCKCTICHVARNSYRRRRRGGTADSLLLKSNSLNESVGANPTAGTK